MPGYLFLGWHDKEMLRRCLSTSLWEVCIFLEMFTIRWCVPVAGFHIICIISFFSFIPPGTATWLTMSFCWSLGLCTSVPSLNWCLSAILWEVLSRWKLWTLLRHLQSSTMQSWWTLPWVSEAVCGGTDVPFSSSLSPAKPKLCSRKTKQWVMHSCGCSACGGWAGVQVYACLMPSFSLEDQLALCALQSVSRPAQC